MALSSMIEHFCYLWSTDRQSFVEGKTTRRRSPPSLTCGTERSTVRPRAVGVAGEQAPPGSNGYTRARQDVFVVDGRSPNMSWFDFARRKYR